MSVLKADLHLHTRQGEAFIAYDARTLIDRAARAGYQVLSITNHNTVTYSEALRAYAGERGILLIPGVERTIEGTHVLLYHVGVPLTCIQTFTDLRRHRGSVGLVVAAHPFFPGPTCLRGRLVKELDLFDALELCHFYTRRIDFNRRAVCLAREMSLPLLGSSDSHLPRQLGTTYSLIDAEPTADAVLRAIRKGLVEVVTTPLTLPQAAGIGVELVGRTALGRLTQLIRSGARAPRRVTGLLREPEGSCGHCL